MRYCNLSNALLLVVYASTVAAVIHDGHRVLRAATRRSDLLKRDTRISTKFESEVVYVEDENGWNGRETFASSVKVGSKKPILSLEEIEHHLQDVQCGGQHMKLHFVDASSARDARAACDGGQGRFGGFIITSHEGCNKDGERAVYRIDDVSYAEEDVALELAVTETLWQDAFDNVEINFGHTRYDHIYRRHSDFSRAHRKRQDNLTVEIPTDTPENVTNVTFDLTSELLDTTFSATDFLACVENLVPVPSVAVPDLPIEIGCKNCSTRGRIMLTQGAITIDTKHIDLVPDIFEGGDDGKEISSVMTGGYIELVATGVGARLEMFARPVSSGSYEIALFSLPILGFAIPGIGQVGASFEPKISVDFDINGEIAVNYGIDVAIPDGAGIKVELGDVTNTSVTGIKGAMLKALPFTSNVTDADLSLSLAFAPTIPIGFNFSNQLSALVTVSMDLPRLDAKLTTNAVDQCHPPNEDNKNNTAGIQKPKDANLTSLVLVEANISVTIDVSADLTLPLLPAPFDSVGTSVNVFYTAMPLMTSCIARRDSQRHTHDPQHGAGSQDHRRQGKGRSGRNAMYMHISGDDSVCSAAYRPSSTARNNAVPSRRITAHRRNEPPALPTACPGTQTLRFTISTPPATTSTPRVIIISASKPCNATVSTSPYILTPLPSTTPSPSINTTTTAPPKIEESKGFLAPVGGATGTGTVTTIPTGSTLTGTPTETPTPSAPAGFMGAAGLRRVPTGWVGIVGWGVSVGMGFGLMV